MPHRVVVLLFCLTALAGCRPAPPRKVEVKSDRTGRKDDLAHRLAEESKWGPTEVRANLAAGLAGSGSDPLVLAGYVGSLEAIARRSADPLDDQQARAVLAASLVGKTDVHPLVAVVFADLLEPAYEVYRTAPVRRSRTSISHHRRQSTVGVVGFWHSSRANPSARRPSITRTVPSKPSTPKPSTSKPSRPSGRR